MTLTKSCDMCGEVFPNNHGHFETSIVVDRKLRNDHPMYIHDAIRLWVNVDTFSGSSLVSGSTSKPDICLACFSFMVAAAAKKAANKKPF